MDDKKEEFIEILSNPDLVAKEVYKQNPDLKYVDANHMVTWIVNKAIKVLEEGA